MQRDPYATWLLSAPLPGGGYQVYCEVCRIGGAMWPHDAHAFVSQHRAHRSAAPNHLGAGDVVAAVTSRLGIRPCTPCEQRRQALNQALPRVWRR